MTDDSLARNASATLSDVDANYDAIHAAIVASERGRWFLEQYARRHRSADTGQVLAAIERIEQSIRGAFTAGGSGAPASDLTAVVDTIQQTRRDVIGRHGDPAASGEAALADFRNAVEQIQELVWDMHGRDSGSEYASQLSLQTNRLSGAGDRIERSLGALRILLGLIDELDQRLGQPSAASSPAEPAAPATAPLAGAPLTGALLADEPPQAEIPQAEALAPSPIIEPPSPGFAQEAPPRPAREELTVTWTQPADDEPQPLSGLLASEDATPPQPAPAKAEFEPLWNIPDAPSETAESRPDTALEQSPEAPAAAWSFASDAAEAEAGELAAPEAAMPEPESLTSPDQEEPEQASWSASEGLLEAQDFAQDDEDLALEDDLAFEEQAAAPADMETGPEPLIAAAAPDDVIADDTVSEAATAALPEAPEAIAIETAQVVAFPASEPIELTAAAESSIEWFELPATGPERPETSFDADLFDSASDNTPDGETEAGMATVAEVPANDLEPAGEPVAEGAAQTLEGAADDLAWLMADDTTGAAESPTDAIAKQIEEPLGPTGIESLFADAPTDDTPIPEEPTALMSFDDSAEQPEAQPDSDRLDPLPLLDAAADEPDSEEPPAQSMAAAALYSEPSYDEPAPSVRAYAGRAYSQQSEPPRTDGAPVKPAYEWPATFTRETGDSAVPSQAQAASQDEAYAPLPPQAAAPSAPPAASEPTAAATPGPFAEEDSDVPSVIERLESVRSAIAALMEEVNDKNARRSSSGRS